MEIFISIDDTDKPGGPGSGQLAANLAQNLLDEQLLASCSNISRHQLYVHPSIPYTSGNSSMCFSATVGSGALHDVIDYSAGYLQNFSAEGSDPGLCVAVDDEAIERQQLFAFGCDAKRIKLDKADAYELADRLNVHLSEHGGTGLGVIGALAGLGLRLGGNDGRFRGWLQFGPANTLVTVETMTSHPWVDRVIDEDGFCLPPDERVLLAEDRIKTVFRDHRQVIVVQPLSNGVAARWRTCTKKEAKMY